MHEIEIHHTKQACGFTAKPAVTTLTGVEFDNKKIAYLSAEGVIYSADDEKALLKALKAEEHTVSVLVTRKDG